MEDKSIKLEKNGKGNHMEAIVFTKKVYAICNHIDNVKESGLRLVHCLAEEGEFELARKLIQRIYRHDNSKFSFIEWTGMDSDDPALQKLAIEHHRHTNEHHLQYHSGNFRQMNDVDIAEWCCDLVARSGEFCTDLKEYVDSFLKKYKISKNTEFYRKANRYFNMLLEKPFKSI